MRDLRDLRDFQVAYARPAAEVAGWRGDGSAGIGLAEVVAQVKPTVLLGTSTVHGHDPAADRSAVPRPAGRDRRDRHAH